MAIGRGKDSEQLWAWINEAVSLTGHTDGAIHAAADHTLAIAMQQGPRWYRSSRTAARRCCGFPASASPPTARP